MFIRCFGVLEPDYYGSIDIRTGKSFLFKPAPGPTDGLWKGNPPTNEEVGHKAVESLQLASDKIENYQGRVKNKQLYERVNLGKRGLEKGG